jgi:dipeptidyl aminopeptidase/acylaminoacyl peptidase
MSDHDDRWDRLAAACGTACRRLRVEDRPAFVLEPPEPAPGRPWVLYAPAFEGVYPTERQAWIFRRVLAAGIAVTGIDVGESFGNPQGRAVFTAWHDHAVRVLGLAAKPCLVPQSRGGLMLYNWAAEHPERVAGVAGIYTVCDLQSYPGLEKAAPAYGMSVSELAARLADHNPVDRLAPLVRHRVTVWHIHGDADATVPLEANAGELVRRCRALGGSAELLVVSGRGHEEHADYFERQEVVDAICRQAFAGADPG